MNDITRPVPKAPSGAGKPPEPPEQQPAITVPPVANAMVNPAPPVTSKELVLRDKPKMRTWLKVLVSVIVFLVLAVVASATAAYFWYQDALNPLSATMHNKNFNVAEGATMEQIANNLQDQGLVKSSLATQVFIRLNDKSHIKAGNYVLSPNQGVADIVGWLNTGQTDTLRVTILPGRTLKDLKSDLSQYDFSEADIDTAINKNWDHPLLADKPADASLEGYVYPETYFMESSASPEDIFLRSFDEFERQIQTNGLREKLKEKNFNLHQGITLASIIEAEVSTDEDMRKVSQVFHKRLNENMVLGSDPTYIYGAELLGVAPSPALDSPYNTRKVAGLPPTPIGNFNLPALQAVVNPANTTYLFFVAGDDGVTHYSYTFAEHEDNIAKYCHRACAAN